MLSKVHCLTFLYFAMTFFTFQLKGNSLDKLFYYADVKKDLSEHSSSYSELVENYEEKITKERNKIFKFNIIKDVLFGAGELCGGSYLLLGVLIWGIFSLEPPIRLDILLNKPICCARTYVYLIASSYLLKNGYNNFKEGIFYSSYLKDRYQLVQELKKLLVKLKKS